jgi:hypothetical protein
MLSFFKMIFLKNCKHCKEIYVTHSREDKRNICDKCFPVQKAKKRKRTCKTCNKTFSFHNYGGKRINECSACFSKRIRLVRKDWCLEYMGQACCVCGYNRSRNSLQFHHLDPHKKDFKISSKPTVSYAILKKELNKCVLLCANCHGEVHAGMLSTEALYSLQKQKTNY